MVFVQVLALADGVNWGEGARLAARCAVRGAIDHMNEHIEDGNLANTTEVFHELLASFHSAHSLILQEGGMLTTLCVAVVAPAIHCDSWVLCVCNVGDSLCFVYNRNYGVREVTMGSHDIDQRAETDNKENSQLPPRDNRKLSVATKDSPSREFARPRPCAASLPCVDAASRHELMLIRMRDIIANGIDPPREGKTANPGKSRTLQEREDDKVGTTSK
ncbi:unnamed protein product, partial [Cylicostephanus goldi]